jgi:hypothetical protein
MRRIPVCLFVREINDAPARLLQAVNPARQAIHPPPFDRPVQQVPLCCQQPQPRDRLAATHLYEQKSNHAASIDIFFIFVCKRSIAARVLVRLSFLSTALTIARRDLHG